MNTSMNDANDENSPCCCICKALGVC